MSVMVILQVLIRIDQQETGTSSAGFLLIDSR